METSFTPIASALGGAMIGASAVILLLTTGRIAGISGILARGLWPRQDTAGQSVRLPFLVGLLVALPLYALAMGTMPGIALAADLPLLLLAGLLVGFGTGYGGGCTSGHGICGIGRLSYRSILATLTFMATAAVTVFVLRHVI